MKITLNGNWKCTFLESDIPSSVITLPNTVQAAGITPLVTVPPTDTLWDEHAYEGVIALTKEVEIPKGYDSYTLILERSRITKLFIDGQYIGCQDSLVSFHVYDITPYITREQVHIRIEIDNKSYPCPGGHLTSKDTQTNWSGILGDLYIKCTQKAHILSVTSNADYDKKKALLTINTKCFCKSQPISLDTKSPALKDFPSESFSEPNWYEIVMASRSTILNNTGISPIVATIDNASRSHLLGMIYEIKIEGTDGNILVCTSDLPKLISFNKNEAYALNNSLLTYLKDQNAAHCPATISLQNYYKLFGLS